jgi:hypothetical protein
MRFCVAKRITTSATDLQQNSTTIFKPRMIMIMWGLLSKESWIAIHKGRVGDRIDGDAFSRGEKRILLRRLNSELLVYAYNLNHQL